MVTVSKAQPLFQDAVISPIGEMLIVADEQERICVLDWRDYEDRMHAYLHRQYGPEGEGYVLHQRALPIAIREALDAYFGGNIGVLDSIPVHSRGTEFQQEVWAALRAIPGGTTTSYGALAAKLGRPNAMRAVGLANGSNPVGIVVPCHRVIGSDGSLTGYGGGLERKQWLLLHESDDFQLTQRGV